MHKLLCLIGIHYYKEYHYRNKLNQTCIGGKCPCGAVKKGKELDYMIDDILLKED